MTVRPRLLISMALLLATAELSAQAMPCLAYRHNDQVRIRCGTQDKLLISKKGLGGFAISGEHLALLIYTSPDDIEISVGTASSQKVWRKSSHHGYLYASCGTILAALHDLPGNGATWDVLTGRRLSLAAPHSKKSLLDYPVCNAARTLFAGVVEDDSGPSDKAIFTGTFGLPPHFYPYGISPSGNYLAYSPEDINEPLCIHHLPGKQQVCYKMDDSILASVSYGNALQVSDSGWVAFVSTTGKQLCYYSGMAYQNNSNTIDPNQVRWCYGIYAASPASPPKLLVNLVDNPQWVLPATAAKLLAGATKPDD